jgi:hypothetical protein
LQTANHCNSRAHISAPPPICSALDEDRPKKFIRQDRTEALSVRIDRRRSNIQPWSKRRLLNPPDGVEIGYGDSAFISTAMHGIGREYAVEVHYELANRIDPEPGDTPEASVGARIG